MLALVVWICCGLMQNGTAPEDLLQRIRRKMAENLSHLPNYTCRENVERFRRAGGSKRYAPLDTMRLEVSYVGGNEIFGWPGADRFEDKPLGDMVTGATATGTFALHSRALFASNAPVFTYVGESTEGGRPVVQFDFQVEREKSDYVIRVARDSWAVVAYHGYFRADRDTLDLLRISIEADEIPAELRVSAAGDSVDYNRVAIGPSEFLLPVSSEMYMTDSNGDEHRNKTRFAACRQYAGESTVSFGEPGPLSAPGAAPVTAKSLTLPPGLELELNLKKPIDPAVAAVGDLLAAAVAKDLKDRNGSVLLHKGTEVTGRLSRMEKHSARFGSYYVVGMYLGIARAPGLRADFSAKLQSIGFDGSTNRFFVPFSDMTARGPSIWNSVNLETTPLHSGESMFLFKDSDGRVPAQTRLLVRTFERPR
jgi:hypothetical protein